MKTGDLVQDWKWTRCNDENDNELVSCVPGHCEDLEGMIDEMDQSKCEATDGYIWATEAPKRNLSITIIIMIPTTIITIAILAVDKL
eukprot:UN27353